MTQKMTPAEALQQLFNDLRLVLDTFEGSTEPGADRALTAVSEICSRPAFCTYVRLGADRGDPVCKKLIIDHRELFPEDDS